MLDSGFVSRTVDIMRLLCPAKINLHLRIGPPRVDGFHPLLSWFCTAGLFDTLILERNSRQTLPLSESAVSNSLSTQHSALSTDLIELSCDQADIPTDRKNLVVKVGEALAKELSGQADLFPVRAQLNKRIPAGGGLGGGSSDGARMLLGLSALWNAGRTADFLSEFAARFGSDLSFFFHGPSSVCKGRGEIVQPIPRPTPRYVLLILPDIAMPTADVYRKFDAMRLGRDRDVEEEPDWLAWTKLDARQLLAQLVNDLEAPAFAINPALSKLRWDIEHLLERTVRMSGSGSSLFTIYDDGHEAKFAQVQLSKYLRVRAEAVELSPDFHDDLNASR